MQVGILGSGTVGQTLGKGLVALGHHVMLGSRDPHSDKVQAWIARAGSGATSGDFAQTAAFGELVILAIAWSGVENALRLAGAANFEGKVLIDATNPLAATDHGLTLADTQEGSGAELIQRWVPGTKVVKAFNSVPAEFMIDATRAAELPDMFIAGNDGDAKAIVTDLLTSFKWPVIDLGDLTYARYLEALAMVWIRYMMMTGSRGHAFKLIRSEA